MKLTIKDIKGNNQGELDVKLQLAEPTKGDQAVHDVVVAYQAAQRMGTACTKTMGEVAGTGKKPWRQKAPDAPARARLLRLCGGVAVSCLARSRAISPGKWPQTRQLALRKALSERLRAGDVLVVDDLKLDTPKTKDFIGVLTALDLRGGTALIVSQAPDRNLRLASRNVPNVEVTTSETLNTYEILRSDKLVFTRGAFEQVEARLSQE
jgi:large subunit ribosomal protein L4